jgi:hypothetical protein
MIYRVMPGDEPDSFVVEITYPTGAAQMTAGFHSKADADAWAANHMEEAAKRRQR